MSLHRFYFLTNTKEQGQRKKEGNLPVSSPFVKLHANKYRKILLFFFLPDPQLEKWGFFNLSTDFVTTCPLLLREHVLRAFLLFEYLFYSLLPDSLLFLKLSIPFNIISFLWFTKFFHYFFLISFSFLYCFQLLQIPFFKLSSYSYF